MSAFIKDTELRVNNLFKDLIKSLEQDLYRITRITITKFNNNITTIDAFNSIEHRRVDILHFED